jgi:hypothetical protein
LDPRGEVLQTRIRRLTARDALIDYGKNLGRSTAFLAGTVNARYLIILSVC